MRFCLFYGVTAEDVWKGCSAFYSNKRIQLIHEGDDFSKFDLHERDGDWVLLNIGNPDQLVQWWTEAQAWISEMLRCKSFVMFVYDGDYWAYQFCDRGKVLDRFVQSNEHNPPWFADRKQARGNPSLLAEQFPWLNEAVIAPYLIKMPELGDEGYLEIMRRLDIRVRPEDEFTRFAEVSILNFLRLLRVRVDLREVTKGMHTFKKVIFSAPIWQSFWT